MDKVSIIIPIYNVDKYLTRCIQSIKEQTYKNFECLLIDDGSTDKSSEICDQYANEDDRFIVRHIINGGVSRARNIGISLSKGKYILFVDADDECLTNYVENLVDLINKYKADCACGSYTQEDNNNSLKIIKKDQFISFNNFEQQISSSGYIWAHIFRSSIIKNNNIYFDENMKMCEDGKFLFSYLQCCNSYYSSSKVIYKYIRRSNSLSAKWNDYFLDNSIKFYQAIFNFYRSKIIDKLKLKKILNGIIAQYYEWLFLRLKDKNIQIKYNVIKEVYYQFNDYVDYSYTTNLQLSCQMIFLKRYGYFLRKRNLYLFIIKHNVYEFFSKIKHKIQFVKQ